MLVLVSRVALVLVLVTSGGCASNRARDPARSSRADDIAWDSAREALGIPGGRTVEVLGETFGRLDQVLRSRVVHREPDLVLGQLILGPGALLPLHGRAAPEAFHVLAGEAEWTVDGETRRLRPGASIHASPYLEHRVVATSRVPLRVLWARWAPGGDRTGLIKDGVRRRGGASTGAFFEDEGRSRSVLPTEQVVPLRKPESGSMLDAMRQALLAARMAEPKRPVVRAFVDAFGAPWNAEIPGVRWRAVSSTLELEWGHVIVTPRDASAGTRALPASSAPGLLHVLSGRARLRAGGDEAVGRAGTTFAFDPGEAVAIEFDEAPDEGGDHRPLRAMWLRWAPAGEREDLTRPGYLTEPMPAPPRAALLPPEIRFLPTGD